MTMKLKSFLLILGIVVLIGISRFTPLADIIKAQVTTFLTLPAAQPTIITGFTPYLNKSKEINKELKKVRDSTNANGVGLVLFHDKKKNLTVYGNYFLTILYEIAAPGMSSTTDIFVEVPITTNFSFNIRNLNECSGGEFGSEASDVMFKNLPPRPAITCAIRYKNVIVGLVYIVDAYDKRSLGDLVELIPILQELANKIDKIVSQNK